jgi:hypothetical protein
MTTIGIIGAGEIGSHVAGSRSGGVGHSPLLEVDQDQGGGVGIKRR